MGGGKERGRAGGTTAAMSVKDVRGDVTKLKKLVGNTKTKESATSFAEADKLFTKIKVRETGRARARVCWASARGGTAMRRVDSSCGWVDGGSR